MTRIKIQTEPPLPTLKAWHVVEQGSSSIADLKQSLCTSVLLALTPDDISLTLDGFLLLDPTSSAVLRDGDLIQSVVCSFLGVYLCLISSSIQQRKKSSLAPALPKEMSSTESSSDDKDSDDDTDSDDDSTSSSQDDSSSDSSSSSAPSVAPSKLKSVMRSGNGPIQ